MPALILLNCPFFTFQYLGAHLLYQLGKIFLKTPGALVMHHSCRNKNSQNRVRPVTVDSRTREKNMLSQKILGVNHVSPRTATWLRPQIASCSVRCSSLQGWAYIQRLIYLFTNLQPKLHYRRVSRHVLSAKKRFTINIDAARYLDKSANVRMETWILCAWVDTTRDRKYCLSLLHTVAQRGSIHSHRIDTNGIFVPYMCVCICVWLQNW